MKSDKNKILETSLVLTTGFMLLFLITEVSIFLYLSFAFGIIGIFFKPVANYITIAWFKLADILNFVVSKIILGILYFVLLFPIAVVYRWTNKDKLQLKKPDVTNWEVRNKKYNSKDLENIW